MPVLFLPCLIFISSLKNREQNPIADLRSGILLDLQIESASVKGLRGFCHHGDNWMECRMLN
jgi:hypothetical protein